MIVFTHPKGKACSPVHTRPISSRTKNPNYQLDVKHRVTFCQRMTLAKQWRDSCLRISPSYVGECDRMEHTRQAIVTEAYRTCTSFPKVDSSWIRLVGTLWEEQKVERAGRISLYRCCRQPIVFVNRAIRQDGCRQVETARSKHSRGNHWHRVRRTRAIES